jgi:hypothetical protein
MKYEYFLNKNCSEALYIVIFIVVVIVLQCRHGFCGQNRSLINLISDKFCSVWYKYENCYIQVGIVGITWKCGYKNLIYESIWALKKSITLYNISLLRYKFNMTPIVLCAKIYIFLFGLTYIMTSIFIALHTWCKFIFENFEYFLNFFFEKISCMKIIGVFISKSFFTLLFENALSNKTLNSGLCFCWTTFFHSIRYSIIFYIRYCMRLNNSIHQKLMYCNKNKFRKCFFTFVNLC